MPTVGRVEPGPGSLCDLLTKPDLLAAAKAEFVERTGGGIGGSNWISPQLPKDFRPPIDYRWPEYVTTVRGTDWWIPAAPDLEAPVRQS